MKRRPRLTNRPLRLAPPKTAEQLKTTDIIQSPDYTVTNTKDNVGFNGLIYHSEKINDGPWNLPQPLQAASSPFTDLFPPELPSARYDGMTIRQMRSPSVNLDTCSRFSAWITTIGVILSNSAMAVPVPSRRTARLWPYRPMKKLPLAMVPDHA